MKIEKKKQSKMKSRGLLDQEVEGRDIYFEGFLKWQGEGDFLFPFVIFSEEESQLLLSWPLLDSSLSP